MTQINISTLSKGPFNNYVAAPRGGCCRICYALYNNAIYCIIKFVTQGGWVSENGEYQCYVIIECSQIHRDALGNKKRSCLSGGESNPGLPHDRQGYLPQY